MNNNKMNNIFLIGILFLILIGVIVFVIVRTRQHYANSMGEAKDYDPNKDCRSVTFFGDNYGRGLGYAWKPEYGFNDTTTKKREACERDHGKNNCEEYVDRITNIASGIWYPKCKPGYRPNGCCICGLEKSGDVLSQYDCDSDEQLVPFYFNDQTNKWMCCKHPVDPNAPPKTTPPPPPSTPPPTSPPLPIPAGGPTIPNKGYRKVWAFRSGVVAGLFPKTEISLDSYGQFYTENFLKGKNQDDKLCFSDDANDRCESAGLYYLKPQFLNWDGTALTYFSGQQNEKPSRFVFNGDVLVDASLQPGSKSYRLPSYPTLVQI